MARSVRSLDELSRARRGAFRQFLPGTDASIKQNFAYVVGKVLALFDREYELRQDWIFRQLFLSTATDLDIVRMHAADYKIYAKTASTASGTISGMASPSITYPAGIRYLSAGGTYVTTAPFTADANGVYSVDVLSEAKGAASNRDPDAVMTLADTAIFPTIASQALVGLGGIGGGADAEDIESLRRRALDRKARPPQGGALSDYERAASDVAGVVNVWARQMANGIGSVVVYPLFSSRANGVPTSEDIEAVMSAITARRLIRSELVVAAVQPKPVNLTIALSPDTVTTRAAVTASLAAFFDARLPGSKIRPGLPNEPFILSQAWLSEVISTTAGEANHVLVSPTDAIGFQAGELPVLGTIVWA